MIRLFLFLVVSLTLISCGSERTEDAAATDTAAAAASEPAPVDSAALARPSDSTMLASIQDRFVTMGGMTDVTVAVDSGVVKLGGTVRTEDRIQTATDVANEFGAVRVENGIEVVR